MKWKLGFTIALIVFLFLLLNIVVAQEITIQLTLFRDADSLTLFIPGNQPVNLAGLRFEVVRNDGVGSYFLEGYPAFQGLDFAHIPAPFCFRLKREDSSPELELECTSIPEANFHEETLADANVFWHDNRAGNLLLNLYQGSTRLATCPAESPSCQIVFSPPEITETSTLTPSDTPTATQTLSPTPTETPTATLTPLPAPRVLFVVDASDMMATPFPSGRTRWQLAMEQLTQQLPFYNWAEVGVIVYGPTTSFFNAEEVLGEGVACRAFEWRLGYQQPAAVDLPSVGLSEEAVTGGAVSIQSALENALAEGGELRTVILYFAGLTGDAATDCGLNSAALTAWLASLSAQLNTNIQLFLVAMSDQASAAYDELVDAQETYSGGNITVIVVESEEELPAVQEAINTAVVEEIEQQEGIATLPPITPLPPDPNRTPSPTPTRPGPTPQPVSVEGPSLMPSYTPTRPGSGNAPTRTLTPSQTPPPTNTPAPGTTQPAAPANTLIPTVTQSPTSIFPPTATAPPGCDGSIRQWGRIETRDGSGVNVRSGPGESYPRIGGLSYGDIVDIHGQQSGWFCIDFQGRAGWIAENLVNEVDSPAEVTALPPLATDMPTFTASPVISPTQGPSPMPTNTYPPGVTPPTPTPMPPTNTPDTSQPLPPTTPPPIPTPTPTPTPTPIFSISVSVVGYTGPPPCDATLNITVSGLDGSLPATVTVSNGGDSGQWNPILTDGSNLVEVRLGGNQPQYYDHSINVNTDRGSASTSGRCPE